VYEKIGSSPLKTPLALDLPPNDKDVEQFVLDEIVKRVEDAEGDVAILVDACAIRHGVVEELHELMYKTGFPIFSAPMGKSVVSENYERFGGVSTNFLPLNNHPLAHKTSDIQWLQYSSRHSKGG
jgi:pyruvate decarboxylase